MVGEALPSTHDRGHSRSAAGCLVGGPGAGRRGIVPGSRTGGRIPGAKRALPAARTGAPGATPFASTPDVSAGPASRAVAGAPRVRGQQRPAPDLPGCTPRLRNPAGGVRRHAHILGGIILHSHPGESWRYLLYLFCAYISGSNSGNNSPVDRHGF